MSLDNKETTKGQITFSANIKKIASIVILAIVIISSIFVAQILIGDFQREDTPKETDSPTSVTLALYQSNIHKISGVEYEFRYAPADQMNLLIVSSKGETQNYAAITGAAYNSWDIKIIITYADERIITLQIE